MNEAAQDPLVERITIDGQQYLRYLPLPVDVALLKGSTADEDGNISLEEEPANLDIYAMAAAAHNSGGKVIFQVRRKVPRGKLSARSVRIPSAIVDGWWSIRTSAKAMRSFMILRFQENRGMTN